VSGTFEPYDSSAGLLANQAALALPAVYLAWRYRPEAPALLLLGAYFGMNGYSYVFGGSEQRAWVALGAITSLFLLVGPALLAACAAILQRFSRSTRG
jgi:hypothetical protein